MSWFASLFSNKSNRSNSRRTMTSTHEAFSLPTSSSNRGHPDAFNGEAFASTQYGIPAYSYPPSSPSGPYYEVPKSAPSSKASVLPLHHPIVPAGHPYPPLSNTWNRLRQWLEREYPELGDTLNYGILPQDLADTEMAFGFALPQPVRESFLCDVLEEWRFWREVDDDPATGANAGLRELMESIPAGWVRREYSCRGWIPLVADKAGNYLGIDMNPGEGGAVGQVIVFGRDFDTKVVMWRGDGPGGWAKFLAGFVDDLENGEGYEMGPGHEGSEGSEDSVGYNDYFFNGVGGGQGDTGGDLGSGGIKLSGEYKGWNVLEAWADKSVRRWIDAGIVPENIFQQGEGIRKAIEPVLVASTTDIATGQVVSVPVITDDEKTAQDESSLPTPLGNVTNFSQPSRLPSISVTKPPAPMPVDLPSPSNLTPDDESTLNFPLQNDIEGRPAEDPNSVPLTTVPPRVARSRSPSPKLSLVSHEPTAGPSQPVGSVVLEDDSTVLVDATDASADEAESTIRLVGAGGFSGNAGEEDVVLVDEHEPEDDPTAEVASIKSIDSKASAISKKQHGRKKSSVSLGLKKLGQLGGKRRTDSVVSVETKQ
ncbi:uncharacterized protein BXZ73DRAFT_86174 [Epithele typhae]|uniref:uncharacterized protein n=1 Tax=Epithele typhae TaxID=378194 RepID=UPI0020072712|nr:uncharacterized protein BXZ73DRAFT_86174 [Epithele typhae]KAH9945943.1 hypothetical protein BXZ73DRAFT_86174 [Epithele typhae]